MMTRNDFEILARHLKAMKPDTDFIPDAVLHDNDDLENAAYADGYRAAINQVSGACSSVNSRFNHDLFIKACGVEK